jgi:hypothetical protein
MRLTNVDLPPPDGPDQRDGLARRDVDVDVGQRRAPAAVVALGDVLEANRSAGAAELDRAGVGLGRLVDQREHAFRRREAALHDGLHVRQRLELVRKVQAAPRDR